MSQSPSSMKPSIRMTVITVFVLATALTGALAIGLQYYFGHVMAREAAGDFYTRAAGGVAREMQGIGRETRQVVALLSSFPGLGSASSVEQAEAVFIQEMVRNPLIYSMYIALEDGDFFEVINLEADVSVRDALKAAPEERWVVVMVTAGDAGRLRLYSYLDSVGDTLRKRSEPTDFDPQTRPWYQNATSSDSIVSSSVYVFDSIGRPGLTYSKSIPGTDAVLGLDITLGGISGYLGEQIPAESVDAFLFNESGEVLASNKAVASADSGLGQVPQEYFVDLANTPGMLNSLVEVMHEGRRHLAYVAPMGSNGDSRSFFGALVPLQVVTGPFMEKVTLSVLITGGVMLLLLPFASFFASPIVKPIRQLAHENDKVRRREYDEVERVDGRISEIDELSESMVTMVSAIQQHERQQEALMDAFIQLIAQAIDDKSPYTGGHCERVPEIAFMLAKEASDSQAPAFRDFSLETDEQWREYRIAAWLHDCGKITTPEHVVDKGSKLEAIYNRIHEVRMRFEVLWRDAELNHLRQLMAGGDAARLAVALAENQQRLQKEFEFIARCNVGGEFLGDEDIARLHEIGQQTWQRHFDDRLGLSPVEELRVPQQDAALPVPEPLLADRPEHIVERFHSTDYPAEFAIDMDVPEHLYNLGELYNLSISRGTLTAEDRFKINEHMISTIKMLERLPFPPELKNVPRYASTHHETMKGTGYPRKLPGEALSVPERILAVADVFEALTAADRPYKKAKPVSVAVDILHKMVLDNHLDKDCFELFVRTGIYKQYAEQYLDPAQLDSVDESRYLAAS